MSIIKIKRTLNKKLGLKDDNSIHDPFLINLSKPKEFIPKETEIDFHINKKTITLNWSKKTHTVPRSFVTILNKYLHKPLPII